jgi:transposase
LGLITKGIISARLLTRARNLLKTDEGWKDKEIAQALNSSVATIERLRQRFVKGHLEKALHDDPRPGAKCKLDGRAELTSLLWHAVKPRKVMRSGVCSSWLAQRIVAE